MTKLRWEKAGVRPYDPGSVVIPPEETRPDPWVPPQEKARRKAVKAIANELLLKRSEKIRYQAMIEKFGDRKAVTLGVPRELVTAYREEKLRRQQRQLEAELKRKSRAAKKIGNRNS